MAKIIHPEFIINFELPNRFLFPRLHQPWARKQGVPKRKSIIFQANIFHESEQHAKVELIIY